MFYYIKLNNIIKKFNKILIDIEYTKFNNNLNEYNKYFTKQIIVRGRDYINNITKLKKDNNIIKAKVKGTNIYDVFINYDNILKSFCNCPYYKEDNKLCKHIYSVIYYDNIYNDLKLIKEELLNNINITNYILEDLNKLINKYKKYIYKTNYEQIQTCNKNFKKYNDNMKKYILNDDNTVIDIYNVYYKKYDEYKNSIINNLKESKDIMYRKHLDNAIVEYENIDFKTNKKDILSKVNNSIFTYPNDGRRITGYSYYDKLSKKAQDDLEKEMNTFGLSEEHKKLVREGRFHPWNFAHSWDRELFENDYYYDNPGE